MQFAFIPGFTRLRLLVNHRNVVLTRGNVKRSLPSETNSHRCPDIRQQSVNGGWTSAFHLRLDFWRLPQSVEITIRSMRSVSHDASQPFRFALPFSYSTMARCRRDHFRAVEIVFGRLSTPTREGRVQRVAWRHPNRARLLELRAVVSSADGRQQLPFLHALPDRARPAENGAATDEPGILSTNMHHERGLDSRRPVNCEWPCRDGR